jgi:hypothetical protein
MDLFILVIAKYLCLVFGIAYSVSVLGAILHGHPVSQTKMYLMAVPVSTFITLQWLMP